MHAEIFALGSELTTGAKLDTNSQWLSVELAALGIETRFHHTVADDLPAMLDELRAAAFRSELAILTGGLGPTADDLTRDALAQLAGVPLEEDAASLAHVLACYRRFGRPMPPKNRVQALVPAGAEVVPNPRGTAPGLWMTLPPGAGPDAPGGPGGCTLVALPGVPAEMKPMFRESVAPRLPRGTNLIRVARVNLFGAGESSVEERLGDLTARGRVPEVGITAHEATITLRIVARGTDETEIERQFAEVRRLAAERVGDLIFGEEDDTLAGRLLATLRARGETLAVAEVGTGGRLADWLSEEDDPAAPAFLGGVTENRDDYCLGEPVAPGDAAERVRRQWGATYALFTPTLSAEGDGPGLTLATPDGPVREPYRRVGDSTIARSRLGKAALDLLRRHLVGLAT
ncbi:molybdopterin-binding protein [Alienimonas californiensis]|uniref:CinA-like protein n=1 Tax=Alienimonas californiensis TaxID=2527989 RepID=A0A517PEC4_9PLAN|nr:molybdopterin-binding protein [Alienimonas californiensis]QDT17725.1 Putative competence-damage inducible protein [Alienimonas californiensis]